MKKNRREFIKFSSVAGIDMVSTGMLQENAYIQDEKRQLSKVTVDHTVATLEDGRVISTPFWQVDSGKDGPSLALIAAQHGNEVQGAEVARRFQEVCATQLVAGSVWLVPMANLLAVRSRKHSFDLEPEQDNAANPNKFHNMQRHWPGDPEGNDTARLAYALDQKILRHCSHVVDMHCWEHINAAESLTESEHVPSRAMGEVTTTRFISYRKTTVPKQGKMMISQMMLKRGAGVHVMELSGQFQIQKQQVQIGLSSMVNIAKLLGMINGEPELIKERRVVRTSETSHQVRASCTGIFMPALQKDKFSTLIPDDYVEEGQQIGHIIREIDLEIVPVISPVSGFIRQIGACHWGLCDASLPAQHPFTEEGEIISVIVSV